MRYHTTALKYFISDLFCPFLSSFISVLNSHTEFHNAHKFWPEIGLNSHTWTEVLHHFITILGVFHGQNRKNTSQTQPWFTTHNCSETDSGLFKVLQEGRVVAEDKVLLTPAVNENGCLFYGEVSIDSDCLNIFQLKCSLVWGPGGVINTGKQTWCRQQNPDCNRN